MEFLEISLSYHYPHFDPTLQDYLKSLDLQEFARDICRGNHSLKHIAVQNNDFSGGLWEVERNGESCTAGDDNPPSISLSKLGPFGTRRSTFWQAPETRCS